MPDMVVVLFALVVQGRERGKGKVNGELLGGFDECSFKSKATEEWCRSQPEALVASRMPCL